MKLILMTVLLLGMAHSLSAASRDALWKQVDEAMRKGLPRTAITNLQPILKGALADKAYAEAAKALAREIELRGRLAGGKAEEKISRLEAELGKMPAAMQPILHTILADWYWQYFQQNRWRFLNRTAGAPAGSDIRTWDLPQIYGKIDAEFQKALAGGEQLKKTAVADWNDLLVKGTVPDAYRPTLYDFIAHEAIEFYSSGEQAGVRAQDAFEVAVDSPAFAARSKFLEWQPSAGADTNSPTLRALKLYQELIRFHEGDPAPPLGLADVDLGRLRWAWNSASGEGKAERYKAALQAFETDYVEWEVVTLAFEQHARLLMDEGDNKGAHALALRGSQLFSKSPGAGLCRGLLAQLEAKSLSVETERVWNEPAPKVRISFRNLKEVHFRLVPWDWEYFVDYSTSRPEYLNERERRDVLRGTPVKAWREALPDEQDYSEHVKEIPAPLDVKPGFYFLVASADPEFKEQENVLGFAPVWVSELALVLRTRAGGVEGFVLNAISGEPVKDAVVDRWSIDRQGSRMPGSQLKTDANGLFRFEGDEKAYLIRVRSGAQQVASASEIHASRRIYEEQPQKMVCFFTDRALYRPGQLIQYKGIALQADRTQDKYAVIGGAEVQVVFRDPNGKEVARQSKRANDFGSFAGSFTAPRDRLLGQMSLVAEGGIEGAAAVRVEEYKRPKFEVKLSPPKQAAKLDEEVQVSGEAKSYTGTAIDSAVVSYRVMREPRQPWWWPRWRHASWSAQEIAQGTVPIKADGTFAISFKAKPDLKIPVKDEPRFNFQVHADVTDSAGETRSADYDLTLGYVALEAKMEVEDWLVEATPVRLGIRTETLDGDGQVAEGVVRVYELQQPAQVLRGDLQIVPMYYRGRQTARGEQDPGDPENWPLGKLVKEQGFTTTTNGTTEAALPLKEGPYRAVLETRDAFGRLISSQVTFLVLKPEDSKLGIKVSHLLKAKAWDLQPGEEFEGLWGTGYESGRAFVEIEHRRKLIQRYWTKPGQTQQQIRVAVDEGMRGGFTVHVTYVRENRAYLESRHVDVPWRNKDLKLSWEHFVSKLEPGKKETWTAVIKGPSGERAAAEFVATLYDESLDAFAPHSWRQRIELFRYDSSDAQSSFQNMSAGLQFIGGWRMHTESVEIRYRSFPPEISRGVRPMFVARYGMSRGGVAADSLMLSAPAAAMTKGIAAGRAMQESVTASAAAPEPQAPPAPASKPVDLGQVSPRKNLNETAFFFPQLTSDSNGVVRMTFTMPEALTRWHFMGFAHDRALRSGFLEEHAVTAKDLMVQPNAPRFAREGDVLEFAIKVTNKSEKRQTGKVRLQFFEAATGQPADGLVATMPVGKKGAETEQEFSIEGNRSETFAWRISIPDGCPFLTYKAVAATEALSDGEEGVFPVLSRRVLVTESLPLPMRGPGEKDFKFTKLLRSGDSKSLKNQSLTVQMVSQPAWYAVLALPYLMEYPYECAEQVFNRAYANALARHIANSDPKIRRIFELWKNTPALESPLAKNQDLKSVMLEETPWVRQAQSESEARRNVGILFDDNRTTQEMQATLAKLQQMQLPDGAWPWFPGGRGDDYITRYIVCGFGRLRHLGVDVDVSPAVRALQSIDAALAEEYDRIQRSPNPEKYVPNSYDALYLYARSFFLRDRPVSAEHKKVVSFFLEQSRKFWLQTNSRQTQGHLALALERFAAAAGTKDETPMAIIRSLRERSVSNEEMGMFWRDTEESWWWYRAPIETQALMIEAFQEIAADAKAVEACQVWLLKQKQTQDWKTTKATADAVYALLLRGANLLGSDALVQVKIGGVDVTPGPATRKASTGRSKAPTASAVEPGTGFYEVRFDGSEVKPRMGNISVRKTDTGVSWGSVHWQYLEDIGKVTPHEGTPLKLKKQVFTKVNTARGPELRPATGALKVGDELVVRIELRTDRDMEYVHMKDQRGSGTEPVNVLSGYHYQDGLGYYESTRDTATHFFINYLPKGTYVFEYSSRVQLRGSYQSGLTEIQCMYAPEFNSHSQSVPLTVR